MAGASPDVASTRRDGPHEQLAEPFQPDAEGGGQLGARQRWSEWQHAVLEDAPVAVVTGRAERFVEEGDAPVRCGGGEGEDPRRRRAQFRRSRSGELGEVATQAPTRLGVVGEHGDQVVDGRGRVVGDLVARDDVEAGDDGGGDDRGDPSRPEARSRRELADRERGDRPGACLLSQLRARRGGNEADDGIIVATLQHGDEGVEAAFGEGCECGRIQPGLDRLRYGSAPRRVGGQRQGDELTREDRQRPPRHRQERSQLEPRLRRQVVGGREDVAQDRLRA